MRILADTNIWIDHFHKKSNTLSFFLKEGEVLVHPLIIGELALGQFKNRDLIFGFLHDMPQACEVEHEEAFALIEKRRLYGRGAGLLDIYLLSSTLLTRDCRLWTGDKRLAAMADELGIGFNGI